MINEYHFVIVIFMIIISIIITGIIIIIVIAIIIVNCYEYHYFITGIDIISNAIVSSLYMKRHKVLEIDLTHWGRVTHNQIKYTNIASDNDLSPVRRQAIILINAAILLFRHKGTYFNKILFQIQKISFDKMHLKISFTKWWLCCVGLNVF